VRVKHNRDKPLCLINLLTVIEKLFLGAIFGILRTVRSSLGTQLHFSASLLPYQLHLDDVPISQ
jgi:hypothetical protein